MLDSDRSFVEVSRAARSRKVPALRGKNVVWLFYEDSTRTRLSFEHGGQAAVGRHDELQRRRRRR